MNKKIAEVLEASRKIVIKIGSNTLAKADADGIMSYINANY